jgi:tetratricopeptide (TPR) repeat protein
MKTFLAAFVLLLACGASGLAHADAWSDMEAGDKAKDRGQYDQAIELYTRGIGASGGLNNIARSAFHNNRGWALLLRARASGARSDYDYALADFSEAIRQSPQQWQPFHNRSSVYRALGQSDRATADRNQAIRMNPDGVRKFEALTETQAKTYSSEATFPQAPPEQQQSAQPAYRAPEPNMVDKMIETNKRQQRERCAAYMNNPNRAKFSNPC